MTIPASMPARVLYDGSMQLAQDYMERARDRLDDVTHSCGVTETDQEAAIDGAIADLISAKARLGVLRAIRSMGATP
jgi:hypothetical protein